MRDCVLVPLMRAALCGALLASTASGAQDRPARVSAEVDRSRITVGDVIRYTVTVSAEDQAQIELPQEVSEIGDFEVRGFETSGPKKEDGRTVWTIQYALSIFTTGEFEIPPLTLNYHRGDPNKKSELSTGPIEVVVESVKPPESEDILDIKSPLSIPRSWWSLWPWFLLIAGLVALAVFAFVYHRRRDQGETAVPVPERPLLAPHEEAYRALRELREIGLVDQQIVKLYYIKISEIIRKYLGRRFQIDAMELTSTEVLERLRRTRVSGEALKLFQEFFDLCDLVKFAKYWPTEAQHRRVMKVATEIIDVTREPSRNAAKLQEQTQPSSPPDAAMLPLGSGEPPKQVTRDVSSIR